MRSVLPLHLAIAALTGVAAAMGLALWGEMDAEGLPKASQLRYLFAIAFWAIFGLWDLPNVLAGSMAGLLASVALLFIGWRASPAFETLARKVLRRGAPGTLPSTFPRNAIPPE